MASEETYENMAYQQHEDDKISTETKFTNLNPDHDKRRNGNRPASYQHANGESNNNRNSHKAQYDAPESAAPQTPLWDSFEVKARAEYYDDADLWLNLRRFAKVLTIVMIFVLVLVSGVMSKLCLTLITSNLNTAISCTSCKISGICEDCAAVPYSNRTFLDFSKPSPRTALTNRKTIMWSWALILFICFPYCITFLRHMWQTISFSKPRWYGFRVLAMALFTEVIHSAGVVLFTTFVLPKLDLFHSVALFLGLGIVPALFGALNKHSQSNFQMVVILLSVFAFLGQCTSLVAYPLLMSNSSLLPNPQEFNPGFLGFLFTLVMISARWWPNYFDSDTLSTTMLSDAVLKCVVSPDGVKRKIKYKRMISHSSSIVQVIVNAVKIIVTMVGVTGSVSFTYGIEYKQFYELNPGNLTWSLLPSNTKYEFLSHYEDLHPIYIALVGLSAALLCYYIVLHAVKAKLVVLCYALPLNLLTPLTLLIILVIQKTVDGNPDQSLELLFPHIRFNLFDEGLFGEKLTWTMYWIPLIVLIAVWFVTQFIATFHMWSKPLNKIASTESLFLLPMFDAECIEQSLLYNRKPMRHRKRSMTKKDKDEIEFRTRAHTNESIYKDVQDITSPDTDPDKRNPHITQIYFCATMWHENDKEMALMMKSVLRMDFDHFQRSSSQILTQKPHPDFYNFETHIFFDDAFTKHTNKKGERYMVNDYVKALVNCVPEACRKFYPKLNLIIKDPVKVPTPYGGRLEWDLPSGTKLIAHLKDKVKIRHKKRWSQVMYMYYFLGELLMNNPQFSNEDKIIAARNTYLLALDGDVDFKPEAVLLLVDMMKKNERVGAACGRIHPIGSGPLVWYQKFEYAISHWLQKATEHVLGCVLCSPGCFSLFRGEALMHENVMCKYATISTQARHYLQYDQGEDRWLCTLMLQAGYKVEYNAAADAFTFAPEGFDEFFNQRRRWGPSTMANILDMIMDANHIIRTNSDMSLLYVIYQAVQFFASIIGPGTIFMMITGALAVTLKLDIQWCFIINLVPNLLFIIVSFYVKSKTQLKIAKVMAIIYALVMCLVLISIILDIRGNPCSPTAIFFFTVAGTFIVAALLHPQEFTCVLHGITYYVLIPCMYMLLIIYSFININNVSWGTREVVPTATEQAQAQQEAQQQAAQDQQRRKSIVDKVFDVFRGGDSAAADVEDGGRFSCGNTCSILCCPRSKKDKENEHYWQINKKLDKLTGLVYESLLPGQGRREVVTDSDTDDEESEKYDSFPVQGEVSGGPPGAGVVKSSVKRNESVKKKNSKTVTYEEERDDLINPRWSEDDDRCGDGEVIPIDGDEILFWESFIIKYLAPLDTNKIKQEQIENQLLDLRVNVNFGFFLTNAMFITIVFTLQTNAGTLSFDWPCGPVASARVEPLSLVFLVFFMLVLGIQFFGMVVHRLGTYWHIMASTKLRTPKIDQSKQWENILKVTAHVDEDEDEDELGSDFDDDSDDTKSTRSDDGDNDAFARNNFIRKSRRTTKKILEKKATMAPEVTNLQEALAPALASLEKESEADLEKRFRKMSGKQRRQTVKMLKSKDPQRAKLSSIAVPPTPLSRRRFQSESAGTST